MVSVCDVRAQIPLPLEENVFPFCLGLGLGLPLSFTISILSDVPVWSKLEVGRIPSPPELLQIIDSQMKMSHGGHTL